MPAKKKSDLSARSKGSIRKRKYIAKMRQALSQEPRPDNRIPLTEEALQREREMNEAVFAEIMAKNKERLAKKMVPQSPPKPKLRIQPPRNKQLHNACSECCCFKSKSESTQLQDYNQFVEPQPLLMPIRSRPTNILVKEARKSLRAELLVERRKRAALRAEKQKSIKLECNAGAQSLPDDTQAKENGLKDGFFQEQCVLVSVKTEPVF